MCPIFTLTLTLTLTVTHIIVIVIDEHFLPLPPAIAYHIYCIMYST